MNTPVTILFDECVTLPAIRALLATTDLDPTPTTIEHILDKFPRGTLDSVWVPQIAKESPIVVTADRGLRSSKGGKLPALCEAFGVTHVVLSGALSQWPGFAKVRAILGNWDDIVQTANAPRGSRFSLTSVNSRRFQAKLSLVKEGVGPGNEPPRQKELFS